MIIFDTVMQNLDHMINYPGYLLFNFAIHYRLILLVNSQVRILHFQKT